MKQIGLLIALTTALAGCGSERISEAISEQLDATQAVDMRTAAPGEWDRVCVLGPYSGDQVARDTLGFNWPAESRSSIHESDSISLLLFTRREQVAHAVEHPRDKGDFSALSGRCFLPEQAQFVRSAQATEGWPEMVPRNGA